MTREAVGFIGLGLMGHGMAKNIVEKGWPLTVAGHRNRKPVEDLVGRGAVEAAKASPFGTTVAHGFLTLSMLSALAYDALPKVAGVAMGVNYGFDKVRFIAPVRAGRRIRGRFKLEALTPRAGREWQARNTVTVEIEGEDKPALVVDWLSLYVMAE